MADARQIPWDWLSAQQRLGQGRVSDPSQDRLSASSTPDWWWQQQRYRERQTPGLIQRPEDVEAVPFGDLVDPVSQAAFLAAPGMVRGSKALLETMAQPGPSRLMRGGMLGSERGNLGPPPMSATGEALPESMVRDETGQLQRLYHGTSRVFPDFEMAEADPAGLYGPGVYMTNAPEVAGGSLEETARGYMGYGSKGWNPDYASGLQASQQQHKDIVQMFLADIQKLEAQAAQPGNSPTLQQNIANRLARQKEQLGRAQYQLSETEAELPYALREGPNVRPVYADLKRPFDMDAPPPSDLLGIMQEIGADHYLKPDGSPDIPTGQELYRVVARHFGGKDEANDWLAANGYDGITHMGGAVTGGQPHRVFIAFSPDSIYPSVNVDALRNLSTQYPPP